MIQTICPNREELNQLLLGKLPPEQTAALSDHLESCPQCQAEVGMIESASDTLLSAIHRADTPTVFEQESALGRAIEQIKQFGLAPPVEQAASLPASVAAEDLGTIRDYRLLARIGEGGMGTVYKALHTQLDKLVALKVLPADRLQAPAVARFKREMKAVGKLHHANIVQAFDAGEHAGTHFLVMELVEGTDLSNVVRNRGRLPIADACELIRQTAEALQYVHEHGMVHRDIKPSNLVLSSAGQVKVLDLGLALLHDPAHEGEELTSANQTMGTADYVAPEQTGDSHNVDIRADIYSLGCTLYKLLTGDAPYIGAAYKTPMQKMLAHLGQPFPDIRAARSDVSPELKAVLDRMVAKEPSQRFATPAEVAQVIAPFASGADLRRLADAASKLGTSPIKPTDQSITPTEQFLSSPSTGTSPTLKPDAQAKNVGWVEYSRPTTPPVVEAKMVGLEYSTHPTKPNPKRLAAIAAGFLAVVVAVFGIIKISTPDGDYVIHTDDPDFSFSVSKDVVTLHDKKSTREYTMKVVRQDDDTFVLDVTDVGAELSFKTKEFTLKRDQQVALKAHFERNLADVVKGSPVDDAWVKMVQALSAEKQLEEVVARLQQLNPGFDGKKVFQEGDFLELTSNDVTDVSPLQGLSGLKRLRLGGSKLRDLSPLRNLNLTFLAFSYTAVSELSPLKNMKLTYLDCLGTKVSDLAPLKEMNLIELSFERTAVTDLSPLKNMKLTSLNCMNTRVTNLSALEGMPLKTILCDFRPERDTEILRSIKTLETINGKPAAEFWKEMDSSPASTNPDRRAAEWVRSIGGKLTFAEMDNGQLIAVSQNLPAPPFHILRIALDHNAKVSDAGLEHLNDLTRLSWLDFSGTPLGDAQMKHLGGLTGLTVLNLQTTDVSNNGLTHLRSLTNLRSLSLHDNPKIGDTGLTHLTSLEKLDQLNLANTMVGDAGLKHLKGLSELSFLDQRGTQVSDAGLANFKEFQNLIHLRLDASKVGDEGLEHLAGCPKLGVVIVKNTKVTEAGVKKLSAALPGCKIEWDGGIVEGGKK